MSDRSVITFYYDYEQEDRFFGKKRVRGLISKEYGTAYLEEYLPHAYNGIKFFLDRCNGWNFSMSESGYDALNAAFDTFFEEKNIITGRDLVEDAIKRADQNLYGHKPDEELMKYMFGYDIFGSIHITYTGSLENGCELKYGYADHGYEFMPMDFRSILDEYDRESAHAEKLYSYQSTGGSFEIYADPEGDGKLYVICGTDENGNEFERAFNINDLDFEDMDYPEFCAFILSLGSTTDDLYELISDDFFVNAKGFDGIFDRGDRISLLVGFIDSYDGENEELVRYARWGSSCAYDQYIRRKVFDFFEENAQVIKTEEEFFDVETKGCALVGEMIGEPKRKYETLTSGKSGPICSWERKRESDDDPIDKLYPSTLTYNCLMENNLCTVGQIKALTFAQLNEMKNIPLRSKVEILEEFYGIDVRDGSVWKIG